MTMPTSVRKLNWEKPENSFEAGATAPERAAATCEPGHAGTIRVDLAANSIARKKGIRINRLDADQSRSRFRVVGNLQQIVAGDNGLVPGY